MGAANVVPGVSGGTIALITGIYERLINALKSFDPQALNLLFKRRFADFWQHVDGNFVSALFAGVLISIVTLARLLEYLLVRFEVPTMGFFFGLILLSVFSVGKTVSRWSPACLLALLAGAAIAVGIAVLAPASENSSFLYVFACGVVAICSMILPGLSGSFVLIVMGNYALVLRAISTADLSGLLPLAIGCAVGLIAFSHVLAWIFRRFRDQTIALMTGFIVGSLAIIWPWKTAITTTIAREGKAAKEVISGYQWALPDLANSVTWLALAAMLAGAALIWLVERVSAAESEALPASAAS